MWAHSWVIFMAAIYNMIQLSKEVKAQAEVYEVTSNYVSSHCSLSFRHLKRFLTFVNEERYCDSSLHIFGYRLATLP